jgi:hypothetical protein
MKRYDELFGWIEKCEAMFGLVKNAIETLNKTAKTLQETKADKDALQGLFDQFRLAMGELNNRVGSLRKAILQKADMSELQTLRNEATRDLRIQGETAAATEPVRCLFCGNPRHNVAQAIPMDETTYRAMGPGTSSRIQGIDGTGASCFVYSETGEMFLGRSVDGKPIVLKNILEPMTTPNGKPEEEGATQEAEQNEE